MNDLSIIHNRDNYLYFMRKFSKYNDDKFSNVINYEYFSANNDIGLFNIFEKYKLDRIVNNNNIFLGALKLLEWTFNNLISNDYGDYKGEYYTIDIVDYAKNNRVSLNCLCHATVLTELLLSAGYRAKKVYCLSCDIMPSENHVVVETYINELHKWVALDDNSLVSMNMWGFTPQVFGEMKKAFDKFIDENGMDMKAHYSIPAFMNERIADGVRVKVIETPARWMGLVSHDDKIQVLLRINDMIYPSKLF